MSALSSVDLEVQAGETLGLIGPNGSGKTTLVNCVSGVVVPTEGVLEFSGQDITRWSRTRRARAGLARTYQSVRLFRELTVAENVEAGVIRRSRDRSFERRSRVMETLEQQGLLALARTPVADLPYGLQRRVEIARALVAAPEVLLLDEPAAGLGDEETAELRAVIISARERLGLSIVIIDHDVSLIMGVSDRITVLHEGRVLFAGSPTEVAREPSVVTAYLGSRPPEANRA